MGWGFQKASVVAVQPVKSGVCPLFQVEGERKKKRREKNTLPPPFNLFENVRGVPPTLAPALFTPPLMSPQNNHLILMSPQNNHLILMSPQKQPPHFVVFDENVRGVPSPSVINSSWGNS